MTRKWRDNCLLQLVRLFLIDEVSIPLCLCNGLSEMELHSIDVLTLVRVRATEG